MKKSISNGEEHSRNSCHPLEFINEAMKENIHLEFINKELKPTYSFYDDSKDLYKEDASDFEKDFPGV